MITRKSLLVLVTSVLFALGLSACAPGSPMASDLDVEISMDEAMDGQNAVLASVASGNLSLTESQASSLITELMKQNGLNALEIAGINSSMDGDVNTVEIMLGKPIGGIDTLGFSGSLVAENEMLTIDLDSAWAGGFMYGDDVMNAVSAQLNAAWAGMAFPGTPDGPIALTPEMAGMASAMLMSMGLNSIEIDAVKTQFDGGKVSLVAELAEPVMGVGSLGATGGVMLEDGSLSVMLDEAFAGNLLADSGLVGMVASEVNAQLGAFMFPSATVEADGGSLTVGIGQ